MKKLLSLLFGVLVASQITYSQTSFLMEYEMEIGAGKNTMKTTNKVWQSAYGSRVENEMNIPGFGLKKTVMLMPVSKPNLMYTLDESSKTYTEIVNKDDSKKVDDFTIEIVGQEKIGIYNCTHAKIKTKDQVIDVWTTKDIDGYKEMSNLAWMQDGVKKYNNAFASKELEGVMVRMQNGNKKESFTMNLVKIEKGNFPQSMFEVPADYKKGMSFDPMKMKDMSPEDRQKMMEEMMKQYGK